MTTRKNDRIMVTTECNGLKTNTAFFPSVRTSLRDRIYTELLMARIWSWRRSWIRNCSTVHHRRKHILKTLCVRSVFVGFIFPTSQSVRASWTVLVIITESPGVPHLSIYSLVSLSTVKKDSILKERGGLKQARQGIFFVFYLNFSTDLVFSSM